MASSAAVMSKLNQQMKPEQLAQQLSQFQAESTKMDMKEESLNDMFDELFEEDDQEADAIMNQVLDEIALDTGEKLSTLPTVNARLPGSQVDKNKVLSKSATTERK